MEEVPNGLGNIVQGLELLGGGDGAQQVVEKQDENLTRHNHLGDIENLENKLGKCACVKFASFLFSPEYRRRRERERDGTTGLAALLPC